MACEGRHTTDVCCRYCEPADHCGCCSKWTIPLDVEGADWHIHTYPVDASLTPDEAWRELCLMGVRATDTGSETWANIRCDGEECWRIADGREAAS